MTDHTTRLVEFTDGFLELLPTPTDYHQAIAQLLLLYVFDGFLKPLGVKQCTSLCDYASGRANSHEPELLLLLSAADSNT